VKRHRITEEEKALQKISDIVSDLRTDIEQVGIFLGTSAENVVYRRFQIIAETAKDVKENGQHTIRK
jgi:hypothetical protein